VWASNGFTGLDVTAPCHWGKPEKAQQKAYANIAGLFLLGLVAFNLMHPGLVFR